MRSRLLPVVLCVLVLTVLLPARPAPADPGGGLAGPRNPGDLADPEVVYEDGTYTVLTTNISLFGTLYNVPRWTTTDFVDWTFHGSVLPAVGSWADPGFTWAPSLLRVEDGWRLYYAANLEDTDKLCIGVATSKDLDGPFVDGRDAPLVCQQSLGGSIDPSAFVDADGDAYLLFKSDENAVAQRPRLWSVALNEAGTGTVGSASALLRQDRRWEDGNADTPADEPWKRVIEQPEMVRTTGGRYFLFYAGNWWQSSNYAIGYATCDGPLGPCQKRTTSQPWINRHDGVTGPGGLTVMDPAGTGDLRIGVFHGWVDAVGYGNGGNRGLHSQVVDLRGPRPVVRPDLRWVTDPAGPAVRTEGVVGSTPVTGDFDGDGLGDVFFHRPGAGGETLLWGRGDGSFSQDTSPPSVNGSYQAFAGDFDRDGADEIFWYAAGLHPDYVWNWHGRAGPGSSGLGVRGTYVPIVGDFDADGADDVLWYAAGPAADYHWWGRPGGFASSEARVRGSYRPVTGDFNGDGSDDVLWHRPGSGIDPLWWSLPGRRGQYLDSAVQVRGSYAPAAADLDRDGRDDIIWYRHDTTRHPRWDWRADRTYGDGRVDLARDLRVRPITVQGGRDNAFYGNRSSGPRDVLLTGPTPKVSFVRIVG